MGVYFPTQHHVTRSGGCLGCKCVIPGTTAADAWLFSHATPCHAFWWLVLAANLSFPERQQQMPVYFPTPPHVARSGGLSWLQICHSRNDSSRCLFIFPCHMSRVLVACLGCKCVVPGTTAAHGCLFSHATSCHPLWWLVLAANVSFPERQLQMPVYFPTPHHVAHSHGLSWLQMCCSQNDS